MINLTLEKSSHPNFHVPGLPKTFTMFHILFPPAAGGRWCSLFPLESESRSWRFLCRTSTAVATRWALVNPVINGGDMVISPLEMAANKWVTEVISPLFETSWHKHGMEKFKAQPQRYKSVRGGYLYSIFVNLRDCRWLNFWVSPGWFFYVFMNKIDTTNTPLRSKRSPIKQTQFCTLFVDGGFNFQDILTSLSKKIFLGTSKIHPESWISAVPTCYPTTHGWEGWRNSLGTKGWAIYTYQYLYDRPGAFTRTHQDGR